MDGDTIRLNESHNIEDRTDGTSDDENVPPLSSFFAGWKAWLTFAVWPIILFVLNIVIYDTLIVFNEYDFRRGWHGRNDPYSESTENMKLSMLRFNATVYMIMLFLDATLLYLAARTVEKEVEALDDLNDNSDNGRTQATTGVLDPLTLSDNRHVHGKISRKLDAILGRGPRPHDSIMVSLLFLACVISAVLGVSSVAEWCFTWTFIANKVCASEYQMYRDRDHNVSYISHNITDMPAEDNPHNILDMSVEGIPDKLQKWAKQRGDSSWARHKIVRLKDKTLFLINRDTSASGRNNDDYYVSPDEMLIAFFTDGTVTSFPNIVQPKLLIRPSKTGTDDPLNSRGVCILYETVEASRWTGRDPTISLLCVDSSDFATSQSRGEFRNVTLTEPSDRRWVSSTDFSLIWYSDCVWGKYEYYEERIRCTFFFNVTVVEGQPLRLVSVSNMTEEMHRQDDKIGQRVLSSCPIIRKLVFLLATSISSFAAWAWLKWVRKMDVAILPIFIAAFATVDLFNHRLALAFSILLSLVAFSSLQRRVIPSQTTPKREELVWLLYAGLLSAAIVGTKQFEEFCLFAFLGCCAAGTILGHPALFLAGWIGGIGSVLYGILSIFIDQHVLGIKAICLGIFGGPGCVTVGLFLIKYQSYLSHYAKRAWEPVKHVMRNARIRFSSSPPTSI